MKIKSLLIGSVAAAGLATGAHAADLAKGVMTSLDVCDALGLSGLTISSDTNCLQVTGSVSYLFDWGDFKAGQGSDGSGLRIVSTPDDNTSIPLAGDATSTTGRATDWDTQMIAWLQVVASQDSDFGVAKAVIKLKSESYRHRVDGFGYNDADDTGGKTSNGVSNGGAETVPDADHGPSGTVIFDRAYVSVGDSTVLTAGKTGTIINTGDDVPMNFLGLFNASNTASGGVLWSVSSRAGHAAGGPTYAANPDGTLADPSGADVQTGGHSIQLQSDLGNGVKLGAALEDLNDVNLDRAGTAVGVISYAGDTLSAHLSVIETGVLDGKPNFTAYHAGFTGTFDKFKLIAAIAGDSSGYWDGLASAQATFDMFKLAASVEATHAVGPQNNSAGTYGPGAIGTPSGGPPGGLIYGAAYDDANGIGYGASATFKVSDGVSLNIGGRYFDGDTALAGNEGYQGTIELVAALTETLTLKGDVGIYGTDNNYSGKYGVGSPAAPTTTAALVTGPAANTTWYSTYYGAAEVDWAPGGGFTSSLKGEAYTNGGYKATFAAAKSFQ